MWLSSGNKVSGICGLVDEEIIFLCQNDLKRGFKIRMIVCSAEALTHVYSKL